MVFATNESFRQQAINNLIFNAYFHYIHSMELAQLNSISKCFTQSKRTQPLENAHKMPSPIHSGINMCRRRRRRRHRRHQQTKKEFVNCF